MKKYTILLAVLGLVVLFQSCDLFTGPTPTVNASTVEFKYVREVESAEDTNPLNIVEGATGGGGTVGVWRRTGSNEWIGEKYIEYSYGAGYYVYDVDPACDSFCVKGRIISARDKDKGQDWVRLTDVQPDEYGDGEQARFELGPKGVYF